MGGNRAARADRVVEGISIPFQSVVIDHFNVKGMSIEPAKADSPLTVHADAVLAFAIAAQSLQTIAGWAAKVVETRRGVQHHQLHASAFLQIARPTPHRPAAVQPFGVSASKGLNHR
jgi:hypothetical protein